MISQLCLNFYFVYFVCWRNASLCFRASAVLVYTYCNMCLVCYCIFCIHFAIVWNAALQQYQMMRSIFLYRCFLKQQTVWFDNIWISLLCFVVLCNRFFCFGASSLLITHNIVVSLCFQHFFFFETLQFSSEIMLHTILI